MKPGDLARLDTSVYWYHEMRTDNLSDRTFLLLDFYAKPTGTVYSADDTADGMTVDRGSRIGIATLLIDGAPRSVWIFGHSMTVVQNSYPRGGR